MHVWFTDDRDQRAAIGIPGDLAGAFGQIAFGERLQTPGQAAEKVFAVPRTGVFLKQLPVLFAQLAERGAAQLLNLGQKGSVHFLFSFLWRSTTVT